VDGRPFCQQGKAHLIFFAKKTKKAPAGSVLNFLKRKERFGRTHNLVGTAD
jgi:hypothetical protein